MRIRAPEKRLRLALDRRGKVLQLEAVAVGVLHLDAGGVAAAAEVDRVLAARLALVVVTATGLSRPATTRSSISATARIALMFAGFQLAGAKPRPAPRREPASQQVLAP